PRERPAHVRRHRAEILGNDFSRRRRFHDRSHHRLALPDLFLFALGYERPGRLVAIRAGSILWVRKGKSSIHADHVIDANQIEQRGGPANTPAQERETLATHGTPSR